MSYSLRLVLVRNGDSQMHHYLLQTHPELDYQSYRHWLSPYQFHWDSEYNRHVVVHSQT